MLFLLAGFSGNCEALASDILEKKMKKYFLVAGSRLMDHDHVDIAITIYKGL